MGNVFIMMITNKSFSNYLVFQPRIQPSHYDICFQVGLLHSLNKLLLCLQYIKMSWLGRSLRQLLGFPVLPQADLAESAAQHSSQGASKCGISFPDGFETALQDSIRPFFFCLLHCSCYCFAPSRDLSLFSSETSENFPSKFA